MATHIGASASSSHGNKATERWYYAKGCLDPFSLSGSGFFWGRQYLPEGWWSFVIMIHVCFGPNLGCPFCRWLFPFLHLFFQSISFPPSLCLFHALFLSLSLSISLYLSLYLFLSLSFFFFFSLSLSLSRSQIFCLSRSFAYSVSLMIFASQHL